MCKRKLIVSIYFLTITCIPSLHAQVFWDEFEKNYDAVIVVTALKFSSDIPQSLDLSIGEDAMVIVTASDKTVQQKTTQTFSKPFSNGDTFYTADFKIKLDSVYSISILLKDGKTITMEDYSIKSSWKTHHYFHITDGRKLPASILRKEKDEKTGYSIFVYSLYPLRNYHLIGGTQIK
jgi:hypothetical protein